MKPSIKEDNMPYASKTELPDSVRHVLPSHAQDIYKEAFNHAWDEYKKARDRRGDASREEVAHKVAWSAVKQNYEKGQSNKWHEK
jgi:cation transport regulator